MSEKKPVNNSKSENAPIVLEGAYVVPAALGDKIRFMLDEMPRKYNHLIEPIVRELMQCHRSDVTLTELAEPSKNPEINDK